MLVSNTGGSPTTSTSTCTPILPVVSIHQHSLPAESSQVLPLQPGKLCWLNAGVEEFPPIVRPNSVRTTTLCRRDSNNIQRISFGLLDQFLLFPSERSDVPVSKSLAWRDSVYAWPSSLPE